MMNANDLANDPIIGIVGGMGPQAGASLFNSILRFTTANIDQQHFSTILMSFPKSIVDRTSFLDGVAGTNPAFSIVEVIKRLETAGANVIGIACNTSHAPGIYDVILEELYRINSRVRLVNMLEETCRYIKEHHVHVNRIGLMTTNGTYRTGIYKNMLERSGYEVVIPGYEFQDKVIHRMIYDREFGLKSNTRGITDEVRYLFGEALSFFRENGTDLLVLGCTDLSVMLTGGMQAEIQFVDSTACLACALIREATNISQGQVLSAFNDLKDSIYDYNG